MINLLIGAPGAGKTYEAVAYHIVPALESGRMVMTNLPLSVEQFEILYPGSTAFLKILEDDLLGRAFSVRAHYESEWRHLKTNQGPLFVVDEAQRVLPRKGIPANLQEWFQLHRHYGADVILITQAYGQLNRVLLDLSQVVWRCRKNVALGSSKTYLRKTLDGPRGAEVATVVRKYQPHFFPLYKSHTAGGAVDEASTRQVRAIWYHWSFIAAVPFFLFVVYAVFQGWFNPFAVSEKVTATVHSPVQLQPQPQVPVQPVQLVPVEKEPSKPPEPPVVNHPFERLSLHVSGQWSSPRDGHRVMEFAASQNGQSVFVMSEDDLRAAGYTVAVLTDCVVSITYGDYQRWLTCDLPRVAMSTLPSVSGE